MKNLIFVVTLFTSSAFAGQFGITGISGLNGRDGADGKNGESLILHLDGQAENFVSQGEDGAPGANGMSGFDAIGCEQKMGNDNQYGAKGGSGGDGSNGGYGGDGGNILAYVTSLSNLKNLYMKSLGGRGSVAGLGASAGNGCGCKTYSWMVGEKRYSCYPGRKGTTGRKGFSGVLGARGALKIVVGHEELKNDVTSYTGTVLNSLNGSHTFYKNIWERQGGTLDLLAPGSLATVYYEVFNYRKAVTWEVRWDALTSPGEFSEVEVSVQGMDPKIEFIGDFSGRIVKEDHGDYVIFVVVTASKKGE